MSAREQIRPQRLEDLRSVPVSLLDPILNEELGRWSALLHWDFAASADLIRRYVHMQALDGTVLFDGSQAAGYIYWVTEEHKGLIGDLFLREGWRSPANENRLLSEAVVQMRRNPWIRRVEAQLMMMSGRGSQIAPGGVRPRIYPRHFMLSDLAELDARRPMPVGPELVLANWLPRWLDESASLIASVYAAHVDSEINDQYRSTLGARRFLQNIIQYPGCGQFVPESSWVALDQQGRVRGLSLASRVAGRSGHIAQICLAREYQGTGAGYELLRRSLTALRDTGADEVSLTVTASNERAIRLYEHFGFRAIRHFEAMVWQNLWA